MDQMSGISNLLPTPVMTQLRAQYDKWTDLKNWDILGVPGKAVCINQRLQKLGTSQSNGPDVACLDCEKRKRICVRIESARMLTVLPLRLDIREGTAVDLKFFVKE